MTRKVTATKEDLGRMYLVEHRTMQEIANVYGVTRQRIWQLMKHHGIDQRHAERFDIQCSFCEKTFPIHRKRFALSVSHYCSQDCYFAHQADVGGLYLSSRQGQ